VHWEVGNNIGVCNLLYTLFGPGREVRVRYDISKIYVACVEHN
jgi:hypothetical protein